MTHQMGALSIKVSQYKKQFFFIDFTFQKYGIICWTGMILQLKCPCTEILTKMYNMD